ncbi:MAG: monofunctional biosynthetic peptidoglycan transglycosylase [Bacteroidetes bacterium]|uniref:Biosynthetic peptidoglycan transglycosylase n=1 Tax=Candidatus Egerieousia excrementavium TaxID=2840778 RepID=A0A9D9DME1_9BACT|nr:monofunctional biosynthetic peptidoglycan transglycosylase [Candidatus Egerieousia excrementavium]
MRRFLKIVFFYIPFCFVLFSLLVTLIYKWVPVSITPLMIERAYEFRNDPAFATHKKWVPLRDISPELPLAVVASEDNLFLEHSGFDFRQIRRALEEAESGRRLRGASTISQQTAKNVFLWPGRSWVRKGLEAYFTVLIELIWGKERIMEVYLNVAEMGKGIYGAEAAAEQLFGITAAQLDRHRSALVAASLPNPLVRKANAPTSYMKRRAAHIEWLMERVEWHTNGSSE